MVRSIYHMYGNNLPFGPPCVSVGGYEDVCSFREEVSQTSLTGVKAKVANKQTIGWFIVTATCICKYMHMCIYG